MSFGVEFCQQIELSPAFVCLGARMPGNNLVNRLRSGKLPRMVDWYDPALLAKIGFREMISGTMGQYADQRQMQAASDQIDGATIQEREKILVARYDYGNSDADNPAQRIKVDDGAFTIDYAADLGDGFEATYAIAYLMASETLRVAHRGKTEEPLDLPAGDILIMGGDQAYPQATAKEYKDRFLDPYNFAFAPNPNDPTDAPERKLFAIPGNHDWYDGLTAFDGVFCSARDRLSGGSGRLIGGWRCMQHRSYFGIQLPHDWWIWGADIQLDGNLDDAQLDYFHLISQQLGVESKVIICLAEPSWLNDDYQNLREISMLARKSGAKVCAVLAGDWHHYSRYHSEQLGSQFITCGGGGAFAHATHSLRNKLTLRWPTLTGAARMVADQEDSPEHNIAERRVTQGQGPDFTETTVDISAEAASNGKVASQDPTERKRFREREMMNFSRQEDDASIPHTAPNIYPSKLISRMLCLWNIFFPFKHFRFTLALGVVYLFFYWMGIQINVGLNDGERYFGWFETTQTLADGTVEKTHTLTRDGRSEVGQIFWFVFLACQASIPFFVSIITLWFGLIKYVDSSPFRSALLGSIVKLSFGTLHFLAHIIAIGYLGIAIALITNGFGSFGGWFVSISGIDPNNLAQGKQDARAIAALFAPILMIPIGGIVAGLVWGLYWVITSMFFSMHTGDAFGALGLRHYKHFLRMRFEPDRVTIYPICIDKVPGRKGWRAASASDDHLSHNPSLIPTKALKPRLIEQPIVIKAADIRR